MSKPSTSNVKPSQSNNLRDRLQKVRVSFRSDLEITRQVMSGKPCYIIRDPITLKPHHVSVKNYQIATKLTNQRTLGDHFQELVDQGLLGQAQEAEFYQFVLHLHQKGLLVLPLSDGKALFDRHRRREAQRHQAWLMGWLFCRIPVLRPDPILSRSMGLVRPLFSKQFLILWAIGLLVLGTTIVTNWQEFATPFGRMLSMQNLPLIWLLLILLKVFHEFGHAFACKHFGGEVPEMGIFMILLTPCAYVDATSSWSFSNRWHRIAVALAGMYFESLIAMGAFVVWLLSPAGIVHDIATYTVALSTVITIGFNANPLMRYDGYYVFSDLLNQPNLRTRSREELINFGKSWLFGIPTEGKVIERFWRRVHFVYGVASTGYMMLILVGIACLIALKIPVVGLPLAGILLLGFLFKRLKNLGRFIFRSPEMQGRRSRGLAVLSAAIGLAAIVFLLVPLPSNHAVTGLTSRSRQVVLHAPFPGKITEVQIQNGDPVQNSQALISLENTPFQLEKLRWQRETRLESLAAIESRSQNATDQFESLVRLQRANGHSDVHAMKTNRALVTSPDEGNVYSLPPKIMKGAHVSEGEPLVGVGSGTWIVRAEVNSEKLARLQASAGDSCRIFHVGHQSKQLNGRVQSITPITPSKLPANAGSNSITDSEKLSLDRFEIVIELDSHQSPDWQIGTLAQLEFESRYQSLGGLILRRGKQLWNRYSLN